MGRKIISGIIVFLSLALIEGMAFGTDFPVKPITVIVYFPAGSGIDFEARAIVPYVKEHLKVPLIIQNVPGASGKIGLTQTWKAKADGYTITIGASTVSSLLEKTTNTEFRTAGFSQIFCWSQTNQVLTVNSAKWKNFGDFLKAARESTLAGGISGRATTSHLSGLILIDALGIKVNWVPFEGGGEALTALAGGHIDFTVVSTTSALPLVKAERIRPLVVFANSKDPVFPDSPLANELGYDFPIVNLLRGADGPPNMKPAVVKVLEGAFAKAVKEPGFLTFARERKLDLIALNSKEYLQAIIQQEKQIEKFKNFFRDTK